MSLELWGGVESTKNRVGERYFDQCEQSGHYRRPGDLSRFAALGVRALRMPVLWENVMSESSHVPDFGVSDEQLALARSLGMRPIVGLVHHGSGPRRTNLLDPTFGEQLAEYASVVAQRYPWVADYTPINEPLTTARFSGLYGHWYPHHTSDRSFAQALVIQCRAVVLAMRAVRVVNPLARLIQTEDVGVTYATPHLNYQAEFENARRWLSYDLLCGRVDERHPLYGYLVRHGVAQRDLAWLCEHPCAPDVVGLNYYLTSDRYLDERLEKYPAHTHGGNTVDSYADIEAVRVRPEGIAGHRLVLDIAWQRYRRPLAFTEVHLGCTREEQLRWLLEAWQAAADARRAGVDVHAVTLWSLLGAYDWNTLVTRQNGYYEPGVFDVRASTPRPTALATMASSLSRTGDFRHPVLESSGWWRRPERIHLGATAHTSAEPPADYGGRAAKLLIVGKTGTLGRAFARVCQVRAIPYVLCGRDELDIANEASVRARLDDTEPWAVVNAAGYVRVDDAEREPERCFRENACGPSVLATVCRALGIPLVTFSSDLVFDGGAAQPYHEDDTPAPLNVYGLSKLEAERSVLALHPRSLIVRTGAFFGPWDKYNVLHHALETLARGERFRAAENVVSPTYVPDLVNACLDLLIDGESGIWHLVNDGAVTWTALARAAAEQAGLDADLVSQASPQVLGWTARRPEMSALTTRRGQQLPALADAVLRFTHARVAHAGSGVP